MRKFNNDEFYVVSGHYMNLLTNVALRLFSENTLNADDYRDLAQCLEAIVNGSFEYPEDGE